ncbi:MAG TPA: cytochrome d ubiquinol oxidase subunit II [Ktedonobacteraceae bacterium]
MSIALIALCILWLALITYAVLGGADFGAGIWDLFATGSQRQRHRQLINQAIGPVWEANHVWLIFLIVGLFSVFPAAFTLLTVELFFPLTIALIGIVLRGAAFIFRTYDLDASSRSADIWSRVFSTTSLITPFFLGASAAAVASGQLSAPNGVAQTNLGSAWLSPFALTIGLMAITLCASLAATYLTQEASMKDELDLANIYRGRALLLGGLTAALGALGLLLSPIYAPLLWTGIFARALPVVIATMLIGLATAALLFWRRYNLARLLIILETAFLLSSWGLSQYPYLIPPHTTIDNSANEPGVILALVIAIVIGMVLILPSLYFLFTVFKLSPSTSGKAEKTESSGQKAGV